jgi:hypothetical protein
LTVAIEVAAETPSINLQAPGKLQIPISNNEAHVFYGPSYFQWPLMIGAWSFFGAWCLEFGALVAAQSLKRILKHH